MTNATTAVGCDGKENDMTTLTKSAAASQSGFLSLVMVTVMAGALLFVAGLAQSATLHDAAHDTRHATGFPCH